MYVLWSFTSASPASQRRSKRIKTRSRGYRASRRLRFQGSVTFYEVGSLSPWQPWIPRETWPKSPPSASPKRIHNHATHSTPIARLSGEITIILISNDPRLGNGGILSESPNPKGLGSLKHLQVNKNRSRIQFIHLH